MKELEDVPISVLDLSLVVAGGTPGDALRNSLDLAQHAERWGYHRYWVAEHHNLPGIASAATAVLIGYLAGGTSSIRVGAGGIMLPNHAPLVIAEQFGTLEALYPGRIDLGLGRAPGTDPLTSRALRRSLMSVVDQFPKDVEELQSYFRAATPGQAVRAIPGEGLHVPIWLLGSSDSSARLAALMGLPFAFASHFAPDYLHVALDLYRSNFRPSDQLDRPYAMVGVNVVAADTDQEAARHFTSLQQQFINLRRGTPGQFPPPVEDMEQIWTPAEKLGVERALGYSAVGSPETVRRGLNEVLRQTDADELILTSPIFDHEARLRSLQIASQVRQSRAREPLLV